MKKRKSPPAKKSSTPIHLRSFGCINKLMFDHGGYVEMQMQGLEISRLCDALERFALRRTDIPNPKVLSAIDVVRNYFSVTGPGVGLTVLIDVPISRVGVSFEPISLTVSPSG